MAKDYFELLGLKRIEDYNPAAEWADRNAGSPLPILVGSDDAGTPVEIDLSRFRGIDDHYLVVGDATRLPELMKTIACGLTIRRSPEDLMVLPVEASRDGTTFVDVVSHHNGGIVKPGPDPARTAARLAQVMAGQIKQRRAALQASGAANISEYQQQVNPRDAGEPGWFPELFILIEDVTWLAGTSFDPTWRVLREEGHTLAIRLIVGVPYSTWQRLGPEHFTGITPRFALGLSARQAATVLQAEIPDNMPASVAAYVVTDAGEVVHFEVVSVDEPYRRR